MDLTLIKNYLRVDDDITEDNAQLRALCDAAEAYITNVTGKRFDPEDPVMTLAEKLLVSHWYTNRGPVSKGAVAEYGHSLSAVLMHIETSDAYKKVSP
jgi:uncharacterized phage protein (possible DNA packaging)